MANPVNEQLHVAMKSVTRSAYQNLSLENWIHPDWILSLVVEGNVLTRTRGRISSASPGAVMIHPPGIAFDESAQGPGVHDWVQFQLRTSHPSDLLRLYPVDSVVVLDGNSRFAALMHELQLAWNREESVLRAIYCTTLLTQLVIDLIETWQRKGAPARPDYWEHDEVRMSPILDYMSRHLKENQTLESLASRLHVHPNYFLRSFRRIYGVTPIRMLQRLRIQYAQSLLINDGAPLVVVAEQSGFSDVSYFCRVFKHLTGITPTEYRKQKTVRDNPYFP